MRTGVSEGRPDPTNQTAFNILLKINVKMGGVNWTVKSNDVSEDLP